MNLRSYPLRKGFYFSGNAMPQQNNNREIRVFLSSAFRDKVRNVLVAPCPVFRDRDEWAGAMT